MGFTPEWLAVREPADQAARHPSLLGDAVEAAGDHPVIVDLGCGTGATIRALAPALPATTRWRLVDNDPVVLDVALGEARATSTSATSHLVDLAHLGSLPLDHATLVTTSAFLDLVSQSWLVGLAKRLEIPFYAALTYDGEMTWNPPDEADANITAAFNAHQRRDKGFGPALGPHAPDAAIDVFEAQGWDVQLESSPWTLDTQFSHLHQQLLEGIAQAAHDQGESGALAWLSRRLDLLDESTCVIGHRDFFARPPSGGLDAHS